MFFLGLVGGFFPALYPFFFGGFFWGGGGGGFDRRRVFGGGAGAGMVYINGAQSHKLSNDKMIDEIVARVEERAQDPILPKI